MKLISYVDRDDVPQKDFFIETNRKVIADLTVYIGSIPNKPKNSSKIAALTEVEKVLESQYVGILIFCDIDTRFVRTNRVELLMSGRDIAIFSRQIVPLHLAVLSGFVILNINTENRVKLLKLVRTWRVLYKNANADWFADQETLAVSIASLCLTERLRVVPLNSVKSKIKFYWTTNPTLLASACTHKGRDRYFFYKTTIISPRITLMIDSILAVPNLLARGARNLWRMTL